MVSRASAVLMFVAAGPMAADPGGAATVSASRAKSDSDLMPPSEAGRFRWELGFPNDAETLARSYDDRTAFPNTDIGLPLTVAEYEELLRRAGVQHALAPAIDVATKEPTFGGAFVDQRAGGVPVFAFTDDPARYAGDIAAALSPGS